MREKLMDMAQSIKKKFTRDNIDAEVDQYRRQLETADDQTLQIMHDAHPSNTYINYEMKRRGMGKKK